MVSFKKKLFFEFRESTNEYSTVIQKKIVRGQWDNFLYPSKKKKTWNIVRGTYDR